MTRNFWGEKLACLDASAPTRAQHLTQGDAALERAFRRCIKRLYVIRHGPKKHGVQKEDNR